MADGNGHLPPADRAAEIDTIEHRREQVSSMLASRVPYQQQADRLGVSKATIVKDVKAVRQRWRENYAAEYAGHVSEMLGQLNEIEKRLVPRALAGGKVDERGNPTMDLWALDRLFVLMERKARLLGLDAPQRIEVTMHVERVAKALVVVVERLGLDPDEVRPLLGDALREQAAITEVTN